MSYNIFTVCSDNYKDAYEFVIGSWLKYTDAYIYIYVESNCNWQPPDKRVQFIKMFSPSNSWMVQTSRKVLAAKDINRRLSRSKRRKLVFLDIDCYLRDDLSHVFYQPFEFAVTRLISPNLRVVVSTGIFFFYSSNYASTIFHEWHSLQVQYWHRKIGCTRGCSNSQHAFSKVMRNNYNKGRNIIDLDQMVYNRKVKPSRVGDLTRELNDDTIKVLHFYNNSYRDKECVASVFRDLKDVPIKL